MMAIADTADGQKTGKRLGQGNTGNVAGTATRLGHPVAGRTKQDAMPRPGPKAGAQRSA